MAVTFHKLDKVLYTFCVMVSILHLLVVLFICKTIGDLKDDTVSPGRLLCKLINIDTNENDVQG